MYSPKIPDRLIPLLYHVARARRQHMTTLVAEAIDAYLAQPEQATVSTLTGGDTPPVSSAPVAVRSLRAMRVRRQASSARIAA